MKLNKKNIKKTDFWVTIFIVIGILSMINFFSYQIFYRLDLTQNKDYSISDASKKTAKSLDDILNIKVYFSENLPSQYINLKQEVGDILDEYANYSGGKIRVEFINPEKLEDADAELYALGIPALQFNVMEKDKYQVVKGYLGMIVQYGDKKEVIPVIEKTQNLEYQVTTAIKKSISEDSMAVLGIVSSNGCVATESTKIARNKLQELYLVRDIDLNTEKEILSDINTLLIIGPKEEFSEEQLKAIDSFLMLGGNLLALIDGVNVEEGLVALPNNTGIDGMFEKYGIKLNNDLVLDTSSGMASFSSGFITFSVNYPFWPKILESGFNKDMSAVANLETLLLPWASSIDINAEKILESSQASFLVKTTDRAWLSKENYDLNPQQRFASNTEKEKYNLAVSLFGELHSAYEDGKTGQAKLILVGDSDFISDDFLRQAGDNLVFFQNLVDILSLDEDLINIRSKGVSERPIKELSDGQKAFIRYSNVFGLTFVIIIFGVTRYFLRKKSRFEDEI